MDYIFMFKKLWKYSKSDHWRVVLYLFLHVLSMLGMLGQPYAFSRIVNALQLNNENLFNTVMRWLAVYFGCFCIFEICHRSARYFERWVAFRNKKRFICSMYDHLQSLPLEWHAENHSGNVIDRVNRAANALQSFSESQSMYISVVLNFIVPLIVLFTLSPVIVIVAITAGIILVRVTKILYAKSVPEYKAYNNCWHNVASALYDYIGNITTIIVLRLGKAAEKDIENRIEKVFPHLVNEHKITQVKCFLNSLITVLLNVGLIFYYIFVTNRNENVIMVGSVTILFSYLGTFMSTFDFYAGDYESVIHWRADLESITYILEEKGVYKETESSDISGWKHLEVLLKHFNYRKGNFNLNEVRIQLERKRKIAFVGESGAGKSTVLKLLRGIYDNEDGSVLKDGKEKLPVSALESIATLIPQEPEIFENTIKYNITMGIEVKEEEIYQAIHLAGFDEVLKRLPKGFETSIQEKGVNLSGGEKQRLALARGIFAMKNSSLVLLDEPTGSLDPATEMQIYTNIFHSSGDKCIVSVLHRLHLVKMFDYIYVFKEGKVVQEGTFDELSTEEGQFRYLWDMYVNEDDSASKG